MPDILDNESKDIINSFEGAILQLEQIKTVIYTTPELLELINNERKKRSAVIKDDGTWTEILNYAILRLAYDQFVRKTINSEINARHLSTKTFPMLLLNSSSRGSLTILAIYISEYFNMKNQKMPSILKKGDENTISCAPELVQYIYNYVMENNPQSPVLSLSLEKFIDVAKNVILNNDSYKFVTADAFIKWLNSNKDKVNETLNFYCFAFLQSDIISQPKRLHGLSN